AKSHDFGGVAAQRQPLLRRAWGQAADQAGDLAGADIERSDQHRAVARERFHLRSEAELEGGHAFPSLFFGLSLDASMPAFAAASVGRTVTRSASLRSIATMSRVIRFFSRSSATSRSSAGATSDSGKRTSMPFFRRRFQRRSPTNTDACTKSRIVGWRSSRARNS